VAGAQLDEEGHLWFDEATGVCTYFQDRRRKWPFFTGPKGKDHLVALVTANATLRKRNTSLLEHAGDPERVAREGERLYVEKPTLRGDANVTWSFDECALPHVHTLRASREPSCLPRTLSNLVRQGCT